MVNPSLSVVVIVAPSLVISLVVVVVVPLLLPVVTVDVTVRPFLISVTAFVVVLIIVTGRLRVVSINILRL